MSYIYFRLLIFFILIILTIILFKYIIKCDNKRKLYIKIIFITFIFINIYPIENKLFKFKSIESAFRYYYPTSTFKKKYVFKEHAYVLFIDGDTDLPGLMYFIKQDGTWKINNLINKGSGKLKMYGYCSITIIDLPKMNSAGISIYYSPIEKTDNYKISDSLSSKFESYEDNVIYTKLTVINESIDKNYTIYFNDKEYSNLIK